MSSRHLLTLALLLALPASAQVQDNSLPPGLRGVAFEQRLGAGLPLDAVFADASGQSHRLGDYFGSKPVILALVYYDCPMLCNLVLNGVVSALRAVNLDAGDAFDVVIVSFDSRETPELAAAKKTNYVKSYGRDNADAGWHFLTGNDENIDLLADAVGFRFVYDEERDEFAHPAGIVLATPEGKLARYFFGIDFPPRDLRLGLIETADSKIGTFIDQVLLFCFQYDPATGRYSVATLNAVRLGGVLTVAAILTFMLTALRRERIAASKARVPVEDRLR
ncbi:MAG: SCO family protein [Acidobacteria bacterium]|nr:SCO family protein [Acidobacteriota bacterium]